MFPIPHFYIGLDLGQRVDFSAFAAIEYRPAPAPHFLSPWDCPPDIFELRQLQRVPLGTPYSEVIDRVARFLRLPELDRRATLVVDATGLGGPVVEMIRERDLNCSLLPVVLTGGEHGRYDRGYRNVPKRDLVANLELMFDNHELTIAARLPNRARLVDELMNMRVKAHSNGKDMLGAEGKVHDDLVLAVALAAWAAKKRAS